MISKDSAKIDELLTRGVENVYPSPDFLRKKLLSGERLTIYYGIDPTGPTIHIGHVIPIRKLAAFQALGHKIIFLIGDFTATIGDPDKLSARVPLTPEQIAENLKLYKSQVAPIVKFDGENPAELRFNSEWLGAMKFADVLSLMSHVSVQQMLERDMFQRRMKEGRPVYLHELMYPLMQGYDSVSMKVDGEVGGNDQTFNMLMGRTLTKELLGTEKFVVTTKLLTDPEGEKMGKTTGNMVALTDSPEEMFGKVMSWTDEMILPGFELCTDFSMEEIQGIAAELAQGVNPLEKKILLGKKIVETFYDAESAERGHAHFQSVIQNKEAPEEIPEVEAEKGSLISEVLVQAGVLKSKTEFRRLVEEGAVHDLGADAKIENPHAAVEASLTLKIGKRRFLKIKI